MYFLLCHMGKINAYIMIMYFFPGIAFCHMKYSYMIVFYYSSAKQTTKKCPDNYAGAFLKLCAFKISASSLSG